MELKLKKMSKIPLIMVFGVLFLTGCQSNDNPHNSPGNVLIEIQKNQNTWDELGLVNYQFSYYNPPGDCPTIDPFPSVVITVSEGKVSSVFVPEFGAETEAEGWPTIDDVFEDMIKKTETNYSEYSKNKSELKALPSFDSNFGHPTEYFYDKSNKECDAEHLYIDDFQ